MEINKTEDITQYIKLIRNSRGYTFEIKVNNLDLNKLEEIHKKMMEKYGNAED